jgi:DNA (cytosine-5)-methyltransferase 1
MSTKVDNRIFLERPRVAEFFAGIGLVRLALERQGWQTVFANDNSEDKQQIYAANFGDKAFERCDIRTVRPSQVPDCELATACFPCTDISLAGERKGLSGSESSVFWAFIGILEAKSNRQRPPLVMIENVEGLLTSNDGNDFRAVVRALNDLGYACDAYLVDASFFVPQSRRRILIIGAARRIVERWAERIPVISWARPANLIRAIHKNLDLEWFFQDISVNPPKRKLQLSEIIEHFADDDPVWWSPERRTKLLHQMDQAHLQIVEKAKELRGPIYLPVYRRTRENGPRAEVRADGLAGCLRTARGGSSRQILLIIHRGEIRARFMSARECARLQGAPESYRLGFPEGKSLFGFGDAVCVPVIEWAASKWLRPLLEISLSFESHVESPRRTSLRTLSALSASF